MVVNGEKCISCGRCQTVCSFGTGNILIKGKTSQFLKKDCFLCGHCMAVCPANAIEYDGGNTSQVLEKDAFKSSNAYRINASVLLNSMKMMRSMRFFDDKPIALASIRQIIEAGRYAPSAGNLHSFLYIVLEKELAQVKESIINIRCRNCVAKYEFNVLQLRCGSVLCRVFSYCSKRD